MDSLLKDLRYALRVLGKSPGFAAVAILSLTLGIGVNTTIFTLAKAVFLRSLPVKIPPLSSSSTPLSDPLMAQRSNSCPPPTSTPGTFGKATTSFPRCRSSFPPATIW